LLLAGFGAAVATPSCFQFFPKTSPGPRGERSGATAPERPCPAGRAGP